MSSDWRPALDRIHMDGSLTLVVGWRVGRRLDGGQVNVADEVATELLAAGQRTLDDLRARTAKSFGPDSLVEDGEYLAIAPEAVDAEVDIVRLVTQGPELRLLAAGDLPARSLIFYAMLVGSGRDQAIFIRKTNPRHGAKPGLLLTTLRDTLARLDTPVFIFDDRFDLIVLQGGLAVLHQPAFDQLFRDLPAILERVPIWIAELSSYLPVSAQATKHLADLAMRNARVRRRLRSIIEGGRLREVTLDAIREEADRQHLDPDTVVRDGELWIDEADAESVLKLLNEDLMLGGLTGTPYTVERKSQRTA